VLNTRDQRDPVLAEPEALHIPTFMARADIDFGGAALLELVVAPFFRENDYDVYGANWAVIQPDAPTAYRGLLHLTQEAAVQPLLGQTNASRVDPEKTTFGAHFGFARNGVDVDAYYQYGFDQTPQFQVNPEIAMRLQAIDFASATQSDVAPLLAGQPFSSTYVRRHHLGTELGTTAGPFAVRFGFAYDSDVVLTQRADLTGIVRPIAQATVGVEYQTGELGKTVLLEGLYTRILDDAPPDGTLLGAAFHSPAVATLARWTFFSHLELETRAVVTVRPFGWLVRPQIGWKTGGLAVRLGLVLLDGDDDSYTHYFNRNQSGYLLAKYSF
jgi:hypothetical protein